MKRDSFKLLTDFWAVTDLDQDNPGNPHSNVFAAKVLKNAKEQVVMIVEIEFANNKKTFLNNEVHWFTIVPDNAKRMFQFQEEMARRGDREEMIKILQNLECQIETIDD